MVGGLGERTADGRDHSRGADRVIGARAVDRTDRRCAACRGHGVIARGTAITLLHHQARGADAQSRSAGPHSGPEQPAPLSTPAAGSAAPQPSAAAEETTSSPAPPPAATMAPATHTPPAAAEAAAPPPAAAEGSGSYVRTARQFCEPAQRRPARPAGPRPGIHGECVAGQLRAPVPCAGRTGARSQRGLRARAAATRSRAQWHDRPAVAAGVCVTRCSGSVRGALVQSAPRGMAATTTPRDELQQTTS